jgi:hypothetical protein
LLSRGSTKILRKYMTLNNTLISNISLLRYLRYWLIKLAFFLSIHVVSLKGWLSLIAMWIGATVLFLHAVNNMLRIGQICGECWIPLEILPCDAFNPLWVFCFPFHHFALYCEGLTDDHC